MHVCAWCNRELGSASTSVQGVPATNWGMCPDCLWKRTKALMATPPRPPYKINLTRPEAVRRLGEAV